MHKANDSFEEVQRAADNCCGEVCDFNATPPTELAARLSLYVEGEFSGREISDLTDDEILQ